MTVSRLLDPGQALVVQLPGAVDRLDRGERLVVVDHHGHVVAGGAPDAPDHRLAPSGRRSDGKFWAAIALAKQVPAPFGGVEVRPVMVFE